MSCKSNKLLTIGAIWAPVHSPTAHFLNLIAALSLLMTSSGTFLLHMM